KEQRVFAATACGIEELRADAAFARARRTGHEHATAAEDALAAEHLVAPRDAREDPRRGGLMIELQRRDRQHREPLLADQEREFVGAVGRAAVLPHPKSARGNLLGYALIEDDHAISHVLLEPVARDRSVTLFTCDDRRHAAILQPAKKPAQFRAEDGVIWQPGEECLDRVEHHALRPDGIDCVSETDKESFKIILPRLLDLAALDMDVIKEDQLLPRKLLQIEAERADVRREFSRVFLKHHEHARLTKLHRS